MIVKDFLSKIIREGKTVNNIVEINGLSEEIQTVVSDDTEYIIFRGDFNIKFDYFVKYYCGNLNAKVILISNSYKELQEKMQTYPGLHKILGISLRELRNIKEMIMSNSITCFEGIDTYQFKLENYGENYLSYECKSAEGKVFTIRAKNLMELIEKEGLNLFEANIRKGSISKGAENDQLLTAFRNQVLFLIFEVLEARKTEESKVKLIKDNLNTKVRENLENQKSFDSSAFWFKHNGVTIVATNVETIKIEENLIKLNTKEVKVINGAQTITKLSLIKDEMTKILNEVLDNYNQVNVIMEEVFTKISMKVTFVMPKREVKNLSDTFINDLNIGLNTQIPITQFQIFNFESESVAKLKVLLMKENIEIINLGQNKDDHRYFDLKKVIQCYYMFNQEPGKARNLAVSDIRENSINKIVGKLNNNDVLRRFSMFLNNQLHIDNIWKKLNVKNFEMMDHDEKNIYNIVKANGLTMFKSFLAKELNFEAVGNIGELNREISAEFMFFWKLLRKKINNDEKETYSSLSSNTFKTNNFYEEILKEFEKSEFVCDEKTINDKLKKILNLGKQDGIESSNYRIVIDFLRKEKIKMENVRTITKNTKGVTKAFSFNSNTFEDIIRMYMDSEKGDDLEFNGSEFENSLKKCYNLFIFDESNDQAKYMELDFTSYMEKARDVFTKTINELSGTNDGNYSFIKDTEKLNFHIGPHDINECDTIVMPNGEELIMQTFWANKETMNELINKNVSD